MKKSTKIFIVALTGFGFSTLAQAADGTANSLDDLLRNVKNAQQRESQLNKEREQKFLREKNNQQRLLADARAQRQQQESISDTLKAEFEANEQTLSELEEQLQLKAGNLGEMMGVVRQVAGETAGRLSNSLVSAQYPDRTDFLETMAQSKEMQRLGELRQLWYTMMQEMTEQGKTVSFTAPVVNTEGQAQEKTVNRVGVFNLLSDGTYVVYSDGEIEELKREPSGRYVSMVDDFMKTSSGFAPLALDPSKGTILSLEVRKLSIMERYHQGGPVGYVITGVLIFGLLLALERLLTLTGMSAKIRKQAKSSTPGNNPLGRIMSVYLANKDDDVENLELKLDEAVLKETPKIERGVALIKVLAAIAPLLGLLGTVTGMIATFQAITLYGTGDPKVMAGGISSALITTVLGLIAAIPLILLHAVVASKSRGIIHVLEEQSTGLIAQHVEEGKGA